MDTQRLALFAQLEQGPMLLELIAQAVSAFGHRYNPRTGPQRMREVLADPRAEQFLPLFGFFLKPQNWSSSTYPDFRTRSSLPQSFWERPASCGYALTNLINGLSDLICHRPQDDASLLQDIPVVEIEGLWNQQARLYSSTVKQDYGEYWIAVAVAALPGPKWHLNAEGTALTRLLPSYPFRYAPTKNPLALELKSGLIVDTLCWSALPAETVDNPGAVAELVFFSAVGPHKKLKAFWGTLQDSRREIFRLPNDANGKESTNLTYIPTRRREGKGVYSTFWPDTPLPLSGLAHIVIQDRTLYQPRSAHSFLHVTGMDGVPDLRLFAQQFDIASCYPCEPSWTSMLWEEGVKRKCIVRLPSRGCQGYWVRTEDPAWSQIIARCAGAESANIEAVGETRIDLVAQSSSETDDEEGVEAVV